MERNSLKPLFRFPGGKQTEFKHYIELIPETNSVDGFNTYVEPFVGGGATFFALNQDKHNVIADTDLQIINFYQQIQRGQGPVRACARCFKLQRKLSVCSGQFQSRTIGLVRCLSILLSSTNMFSRHLSKRSGWTFQHLVEHHR